MDNNYLRVYGNSENIYLEFLLNGLEEQSIKYEVLPLEQIKSINYAKVPFNIAVEVNENMLELKSNEFMNMINFKVKASDNKIAKEFGLDVGRYIKKIPLKGDWYE